MEIDYRVEMAVPFCNQFKSNTFELNESVVLVFVSTGVFVCFT